MVLHAEDGMQTVIASLPCSFPLPDFREKNRELYGPECVQVRGITMDESLVVRKVKSRRLTELLAHVSGKNSACQSGRLLSPALLCPGIIFPERP